MEKTSIKAEQADGPAASTPHGGVLVDLRPDAADVAQIREGLGKLPTWTMTARQECDLECLIHGAFTPLTGFLGEEDYGNVCRKMRLADGTLWPMPVVLDVDEAFAETIAVGDRMVLRDREGAPLAVLDVSDKWRPDPAEEAQAVYGTTDPTHFGVDYLFNKTNPVYVGGRVTAVEPIEHHDFKHLRHTPRELRDMFAKWGWSRIVAFQTRNPMHKAHYEIAMRAAHDAEANLLVHPVVGETKDGDIDHYTRVRGYQALFKYFPQQTSAISLLPLAMRMAGPREAVWHAIIRKNHGCTHFVVGRDHAGPGSDANGEPFYGPFDAQQLLRSVEDEIGITMVPLKWMVYVEGKAQYMPADEAPADDRVLTLSGTEMRRRLREDLPLPSWFSFPEVIAELRRAYPPRSRQGFTAFFTGLSGAGKSTIAKALQAKFLEMGDRPVTLLDGDIVRRNLSSELGFSKEHRNLNIQRIGFVAAEITKNRGIAICAPIAPYNEVRQQVRKDVEHSGGFVLIHVATPLEVCEQRDRKGLYKLAREGVIKEFTGISDPYETPEDADIVIDTTQMTPEEAAQRVFLHIEKMGYIA